MVPRHVPASLQFSAAGAFSSVTGLARIRVISLVPLDGKENPKGNLETWSTTQKDILVACPGMGSHLAAGAFTSVATRAGVSVILRTFAIPDTIPDLLADHY